MHVVGLGESSWGNSSAEVVCSRRAKKNSGFGGVAGASRCFCKIVGQVWSGVRDFLKRTVRVDEGCISQPYKCSVYTRTNRWTVCSIECDKLLLLYIIYNILYIIIILKLNFFLETVLLFVRSLWLLFCLPKCHFCQFLPNKRANSEQLNSWTVSLWNIQSMHFFPDFGWLFSWERWLRVGIVLLIMLLLWTIVPLTPFPLPFIPFRLQLAKVN